MLIFLYYPTIKYVIMPALNYASSTSFLEATEVQMTGRTTVVAPSLAQPLLCLTLSQHLVQRPAHTL